MAERFGTPAAPRGAGNSRAFSFVELMIAVAVIVIGIIPIYSLMMSGNRSFAKSENNSIAYNLAMEALEWARSAPYEQVISSNVNNPSSRYTFPVALDLNFVTREPAPAAPYRLEYPQRYFKYFSNFSREMKIEDFGDRTKKVTVTVRWTEDRAERREEVSAVVIDQRMNN